MPDKDKIQQALIDFDVTIKAKPNLSDKELLSKFPEFGNDINKLQAAKDYSATLNSGKYKDPSEFNSKFPEFFAEEVKKNDTPSPSSATQLPLPNQPINPLQQGANIVGGGVLKEVSKGVPQSIGDGISRDKKNKDSVLGGIYNTLVGSISSLAGGATYMAAALPSVGKQRSTDKTPEQARQQAEGLGENLRSESSSRENEQALSKFDIIDGSLAENIKGLAFQAPKTLLDMGMGALTGGTSFFAQSVNDGSRDLEENPNASKLTQNQKLGYLYTTAAVTAVLEKYSLDRLFKGSGITKQYTQKITKEIIDDFAKKGIKATAKEIEQAAVKKASQLSQKLLRSGKGTAESILSEGATEGLQSASGDGIKLLVNKLKGEEIFNEQDIAENFLKNTINASAAGGIFGGLIGGTVSTASNTNKGVRNQIAKANTPEELQKIQDQLNTEVELGNITPEEAQAAGIKAQQYAEIAGKIPETVPQEKKYDIIGGIEQRETIKKDIEALKADINSIDEAFPEYKQGKQDQLSLLEGKLGQVNDYLESIVSDVKPKYVKEGDKFYKVVADGRQMTKTEIPENHYIAGKLVEEVIVEDWSKDVESTAKALGKLSNKYISNMLDLLKVPIKALRRDKGEVVKKPLTWYAIDADYLKPLETPTLPNFEIVSDTDKGLSFCKMV